MSSKSLFKRNYELIVEFPTLDSYKSKEVNSLYVFRLPITKTASFSLLSIPLKYSVYATLKTAVQYADHFSTYPKIFINFYLSEEKVGEREGDENKLIAKKSYRILKIKNIEEEKTGVNKPVVNLYIVNDSLWYLNNTTSFNDIGEDTTGVKFLEKYEKFINEIYTGFFNFKKNIEEKNEYEYEQIFLKSDNDLKFPTHLINNYKLTNVFSYYFFDDFKLDGESDKDVNCLFVSLSNKELFKKIDIFDKKYRDHQSNFKQITSIILKDYFQIFNKKDPVINLKDKDQRFKKEDENETEPVVISKSKEIKEEIIPGRKIGSGEFDSEIEEKSPTKSIDIYCPDNFELGLKRIELMKNVINKKFDTIEFFELYNCHVDLIQFDRIYNLNFSDRDLFLFLPISIVNIFRKKEMNQYLCDHTAKFQCLKFKSDPE